MFRQTKPRQMRSFRLDQRSSERLKELSSQLGASQGELIEELINACYDSACVDFDIQGFERFTDRCKEIKEKQKVRKELGEVFREMQEQSAANETDKLTMEEIVAEITTYRREKSAVK
jgi:predicted DNA-binding protein